MKLTELVKKFIVGPQLPLHINLEQVQAIRTLEDLRIVEGGKIGNEHIEYLLIFTRESKEKYLGIAYGTGFITEEKNFFSSYQQNLINEIKRVGYSKHI